MQIYLKPILSACYMFPFLALLFTLPYIIRQYNKYGSILVLRTGIVYSFIFYMMTSYFMTILPLPPVDSVTPASATVLLTPFDAVHRAVTVSAFDIRKPDTYVEFLLCSDFLQIVFNMVLLIPFGVYLRYYFNKKWYTVLLLSFCYSLFFELTQLSGLYGIYPYPYRFFEVDDLICNTLGGMVGFWLTPALLFFLPSRERLDKVAYKRGMEVSSFRRVFALLADYGVIFILYFALTEFVPLESYLPHRMVYFTVPVLAFVYFLVLGIITSGRSIGKFLVNIKIQRKDGKRAGWFALLFRMGLLHMCLIPAPRYVLSGISILSTEPERKIEIIVALLLSVFLAYILFFVCNFIFCFVGKNKALFYDYLTGLTVVSMTKAEE